MLGTPYGRQRTEPNLVEIVGCVSDYGLLAWHWVQPYVVLPMVAQLAGS